MAGVVVAPVPLALVVAVAPVLAALLLVALVVTVASSSFNRTMMIFWTLGKMACCSRKKKKEMRVGHVKDIRLKLMDSQFQFIHMHNGTRAKLNP